MSAEQPPRGADRRRAPRFPVTRLPLLRASILAGPDVTIINVSRGGLLLESEMRLRPGFGICLNLTLNGRIHVLNGRVSHATALTVDGRLIYRVGVSLDEETAIFDPIAAHGREAAEEDPNTAARVPPPPRSDDRPETDANRETSSLREQLNAERRDREQLAGTIQTMREGLQSGERLRQEIIDAHAADRVLWEAEQQELVERVREAEEQAASMIQDMRAARDSGRRAARQQAQRVAALETQVREREQQLAEVRAAQAALLESLTERVQMYERKDRVIEEQRTRMTAQLATTETWCTDQQDLLYRIRQQINMVFGLLQGSDSIDRRSLPGATVTVLPDDVTLLPSPERHRVLTPVTALEPATKKTGT
jgi:hypothetical protein